MSDPKDSVEDHIESIVNMQKDGNDTIKNYNKVNMS